MAEDDDDSQKTEEPSEKRLEDARQKGQNFNSKEINHFFILLALTFSIAFLSPQIFKEITSFLSLFIENSHQINLNNGDNIRRIMSIGVFKSFSIVIIPILLTVLVTIISSYIQHGEFRISANPLIPKFERLSIIKGLGRIFSINAFVEFIKNLVKLIIIGIVCYLSIRSELKHFKIIHEYSTYGYIKFLLKLVDHMLIQVCIVMALLAGADYMYQRYSFYKSLMMTKQEQKDEHKQSEGNPEIKSRLRSLRLERAKNRMMAEVPKADVVVTNPTHFAVALKYEMGGDRAPIVVAKGKDLVALRIRDLAQEKNIPVIENPPLARGLYKSVKLNAEIPIEYYKAVAEIINYIYRLKEKFK